MKTPLIDLEFTWKHLWWIDITKCENSKLNDNCQIMKIHTEKENHKLDERQHLLKCQTNKYWEFVESWKARWTGGKLNESERCLPHIHQICCNTKVSGQKFVQGFENLGRLGEVFLIHIYLRHLYFSIHIYTFQLDCTYTKD